MIINKEEIDEVVYIKLSGNLKDFDSKLLKESFEETYKSGKNKVVVVFGSINYITSTVIGSLVNGLKKFREAGGDLRLAGLTFNIRHILQITGLDKIFVIYQDVDEAKVLFK
jgi:anti-sigma B factor antagonist